MKFYFLYLCLLAAVVQSADEDIQIVNALLKSSDH